MFNTSKHSFFSAILAYEEQKFIDNITVSFEKDTNEFKKGSTLIRVLPNRKSFQNIVTRSKIVMNRELINGAVPVYEWGPLFNDVTANIRTLDTKVSFIDAINIINKLYNTLGSTLYGILLISDDEETRVNPLHPLVAMQLCTHKTNMLWTVAIYTYANKPLLDAYYNSTSADLGLINENLQDQLTMYINRYSNTKRQVEDTSYNSIAHTVKITYKIKQHKDEDTHREVNLVTHQMLTNGTIAPYYGTSIVQKIFKTQQASGMTLTPMMSSNIRSEIDLNGFDYNREASKIVSEYVSVCTGTSFSNTTPNGLRTLVHSNTLSPHIRNIIQAGALPYVSACIAKSIEIYKLAKLIKEG